MQSCFTVGSFYLHMAITVGEDVKQAYLHEVLKDKKKKKKCLVCFQSAIKQTQIINVPLQSHYQNN